MAHSLSQLLTDVEDMARHLNATWDQVDEVLQQMQKRVEPARRSSTLSIITSSIRTIHVDSRG